MTTPRLYGQKTVLLGSGGSVGHGLNRGQLEAGADVVIVGRNQERLKETLHAFADDAHRLTAVRGDLGSFAAADALAESIVEASGPYDHVVIGLTAWMQGVPFWEVAEDSWVRALDQITGYFAAARALTPHIRSGGSLSLILSLSAYMAFPTASPVTIYGGALRAMRPAFSCDLGQRVRVNTAAFAPTSSWSRGANVSPDWLTEDHVGRVMARIAASDLTGTDLKFPDRPTYEAFIDGDISQAGGTPG